MNEKRRTRLLIVLIALGFAARIGLLCISRGHVDAALWEQFGSEVARMGLRETYLNDYYMNHPPLAALFAGAVYRLSQATGLSFAMLFRAPMILADALTCLILFQIYRSRARLAAAALFAWNLDAFLLSSFHGNTDPAYAMLCVATVWLADSERKPLLAGLILGLAINIKLLPAMLVLPLLLLSRSWREFFRIFTGLAIMALPYLWGLAELGYPFRVRVFSYGARGGTPVSDLLLKLETYPMLRNYIRGVFERYAAAAKVLVITITSLPALFMRSRGQWNRYRAFAMAAVLFAVFSPGFAIHYTAMVGALLMAYDLRAGFIWGVITGLELLSHYYFLWDGKFPIAAQTAQDAAGPWKYFGMLAAIWALLWLIWEMRSRPKPVPDAVSVPPGST